MCSDCGFVYTNPRPTEKVMESFYRHDYRTYYSGELDADRGYERMSVLKIRAKKLLKILPEIKPEAKILDVGCESGSLLQVCKDLYPQAELSGIEPSSELSEFARNATGANIYNLTLQEFFLKHDPEDLKFNIIVLNHVLEHLYHPVQKLTSLTRYLTPDGLIILEVPDMLSPSWIRPKDMFHIAHISHFTLESLLYTLSLAGLKSLTKPSFSLRAVSLVCTRSEIDSGKQNKPIANISRALKQVNKSDPNRYIDRFLNKPGIRFFQKQFQHLSNDIHLKKIFYGHNILILGKADPSRIIPETILDSKIITCDNGLIQACHTGLFNRIDLYLVPGMDNSRRIERILPFLSQIEISAMIVNNKFTVPYKSELFSTKALILNDQVQNNNYLKRLISPEKLSSIATKISWHTSSVIRLLQYALYFKSKNIYLTGFENDKSVSDIDRNFLNLMKKKFNCIEIIG